MPLFLYACRLGVFLFFIFSLLFSSRCHAPPSLSTPRYPLLALYVLNLYSLDRNAPLHLPAKRAQGGRFSGNTNGLAGSGYEIKNADLIAP